MKKTWMFTGALMAAAVMMVAGVAADRPVVAQQGQWPAIRVAVINVKKVFDGYAKFKTLIESLKSDYEAKENELRASEQMIRSKLEQLKDMKSQADRDKVEKEIADHKFNFERNRRKYQQDFMAREAGVVNTVYKEMTDLLGAYCQEQGIHMVLRLNDEVEDASPQAVMQTLYKQVVYHHPNLDLTSVVADGLNAQVGKQPAAAAPAAGK